MFQVVPRVVQPLFAGRSLILLRCVQVFYFNSGCSKVFLWFFSWCCFFPASYHVLLLRLQGILTKLMVFSSTSFGPNIPRAP